MKDIDVMILGGVAIGIGCFVLIYLPWIFIRGKAANYDPYDKLPDEGVNGWLLLMLVQVFSFTPISSLVQIFNLINVANRIENAAFTNYAYALVVLLVALCVASFKYHLPLIRTRQKAAVTDLKRFYLWLPVVATALLYLCSKLLLEPTYPSLHKATVVELPAMFVSVGVASGIWYWYLSKSKRVASTYRQDTPEARSMPLPVKPVEPSWTFVKSAGLAQSEPVHRKSPIGRQDLKVLGDVSEAFSTVRVSRHEVETASGRPFERDVWQECLSQSKGDEVAAMALYRLREGR